MRGAGHVLVRRVLTVGPGGRGAVGVVLSVCGPSRNPPGGGGPTGAGVLRRGRGCAVAGGGEEGGGGGGDGQQRPLPSAADGGGGVRAVGVWRLGAGGGFPWLEDGVRAVPGESVLLRRRHPGTRLLGHSRRGAGRLVCDGDVPPAPTAAAGLRRGYNQGGGEWFGRMNNVLSGPAACFCEGLWLFCGCGEKKKEKK